MTDPGACPDLETLALLAQGDAATRERHGAHLADCPDCLERLSAILAEGGGVALPRADREQVWRTLSGRIGAPRPRISLFRPRPLLAAAATVTILAVGAAVWLSRETPPATVPQGPILTGARPLSPAETRVSAGPEKSDTFLCPDGSAARLAPGSAASFLPPGPGERVRLRLDRGTLDAEVLKSRSGFVVAADGGEVRVVGTFFRVRAFRIHTPAGDAIPFLSVEVTRGAVDLAGPQGTRRIAAGARGLVWKGEGPLLQAAEPLHWQEALRKWGSAASASDFAGSPGCAVLLGGSWLGADTWREALRDVSASSNLRRSAAALVGMTASPEDREALLGDFRDEADPAVRGELLPHLARVLGAEASSFLKSVSTDDPDAKVRDKAAALLKDR